MTVRQLQFVQNLLKEKHRYEEELPSKAQHKLAYLIYTQTRERGGEINIPYFWYRYGVVTQPTPDGDAGPGSGVDSDTEEIATRVSEQVLEQYYKTSLEEVTDVTYREAPYDIFRDWRELDKQLSSLKDNYNPFFDNTPIKNELEQKINRVYDSFPENEYPQHIQDLSTWYFAMTRELDIEPIDIPRLQNINTTFWGIFTTSVAEQHHPNMSRGDVLRSLDLSSFEHTIDKRREKLSRLEREALDERFEDGEGDLSVGTDAMLEPIMESL